MAAKNRARLLLIPLLLAGAPALAQTRVTAVKGGKVITPSGRAIENGVVVITDGTISAVGPAARVKVPYTANVISAKGKVVFPGMILAHTSRGMDRPNENLAVAPFLDVYDSIDPSSMTFEDALRDGVTSLHVIHGNDTVIGGLGRVVHPVGLTVGSMTALPASGLKIAVAGKRGYGRVRQRAELRETFAKLTDYLDDLAEKRYEEEEKKAKRDVTVPPAKARELGRKLIRDEDLDDKHRNLYRLTQGKVSAFVYVPRAQDVRFAIELATQNGFLKRTTWVLDEDTYKAVAELKKSGRPVILSPTLVHREFDADKGEWDEVFVPSVFYKAKIPFALLNSPGASFAERFLWYQAARCVREGIDRATALRAITDTPAKILGLGKRLGAIEKGRDGDLLILSGDPLEITTRVEQVLIGGKPVYDRAKDWRLRRLLSGEKPEGDDKKDGDKKADDKKADDKKADDKKQAPEKKAPEKKAPEKKAPEKKGGDDKDDDFAPGAGR